MTLSAKLDCRSCILLVSILHCATSTQKTAWLLGIIESSWANWSTVNPRASLSSSTHSPIQPSRVLSRPSETFIGLVSPRRVNSSKSSLINPSADITFLRPLTQEVASFSEMKLPKNTERATIVDSVKSSNYEHTSQLNNSAKLTLIQNTTSPILAKDLQQSNTTSPILTKDLHQSNLMNLNVSAALPHINDQSNDHGYSKLASKGSKSSPYFRNVIPLVGSKSGSESVITNREQETMTWFSNISTGDRRFGNTRKRYRRFSNTSIGDRRLSNTSTVDRNSSNVTVSSSGDRRLSNTSTVDRNSSDVTVSSSGDRRLSNASTVDRHSSDVNVSSSALVETSRPSKNPHRDAWSPCNEDCSKMNLLCVVGIDLTPRCLKAVDPCDQMPCENGHCVSDDEGHLHCQCNPGWVGALCDDECTLDCGNNGHCDYIDHTPRCVCSEGYRGKRCHRKVESSTSHVADVPVSDKGLQAWGKAVVAAVAVVLVALSCVLLPYMLWRRQWMPMRKLVFRFQEFEDDNEKEYDAFVSYKSSPSDERFILTHLYPKLEKEWHFRLCLHFRDFPPGEPIANNIIKAIEGSRRTILILSPNFITSEWCRLEYQKAQHEMLRLKHKIIPIIVEDISHVPEMDRNLKTIMDSVTYITWPGGEESTSSNSLAKFWKLLQLSMPKRRPEILLRQSSSVGLSSEVPRDKCNGDGASSLSCDESPGDSSPSINTCPGARPSAEHPSRSNGFYTQIAIACSIVSPPRATGQEVNDNRISRDNEAQLSSGSTSTSQDLDQGSKSPFNTSDHGKRYGSTQQTNKS